jgi:hypothetical protein
LKNEKAGINGGKQALTKEGQPAVRNRQGWSVGGLEDWRGNKEIAGLENLTVSLRPVSVLCA